MTIERLEELTNEYLQKMQGRVIIQTSDRMSDDLTTMYKHMTEEFINIEPVILEKYREQLELDPMRKEINDSSKSIVDKIYEKIVIVRRAIERDENIEKIKEYSQAPEKEDNFGRQIIIQDKLQETFKQIERIMRIKEYNIDWDSLKGYCNRIISNYTEAIEKDVFEKNEEDIISEEVQRYIEEIEQEMRHEKSENIGLKFKEGPVCPVVTDTNGFAKVNQQIADDVREKQEELRNEPTRENDNLELPGDAIW